MFEIETADCPYCARSAGRLEKVGTDYWAVTCSKCGGAGPLYTSPRDAVAEWNNRRALATNLGLMRQA
jgi:ribosomal protein L37AE/L43A